jgi:predicted enzyme related to lactoylglutathione lyase
MKFGYAILYVPNVERTVEFYESAFGLRRKFVDAAGYAELETGETTLAFVSLEVAKAGGIPILPPSSDDPPHAIEVALVTDDVAGSFEHAIKNGAVSIAEPADKPWGQTVSYVRDINGFLIEICSPVKK